ncbi:sugar porter (SP) family MFS transporter [Lewinella marina]|uniref:MFS transporter n=1 Tax=Neolewinella marina TaxID=438751 RepID=A0A2G0CDK6_9BACT|nr:MFS transporter [Neolewinella marina]NJB85963.1 sugar porter (SP) family MFS transporter [Neolewinella marina]PHK98066.1 MFS transporter [Neolewinella marina]
MNPYRRNAFAFAAIVALGGFVFGLDAALISGTVNFIAREFNLSDLELGMAVGAPGLGVVVALPLTGLASNLLGRKKTLQIIAALYLVSAVSSALAPTFWALVASRFLGGLAFSSITVASMYIGEIAPPDYRGKLVAILQINIVLGLSTAYFTNYLILLASNSGAEWLDTLGITTYTWRWMLGSEILPALLWLALLSYIPNSPAWLIYRGRRGEAMDVLRRLLPVEEIPEAVHRMEDSLRQTVVSNGVMDQLKRIFGPRMRLVFLIAFTVAIVQQATGINAVLFYAPTIFEQLGFGMDAAFAQAIWVGLTSIVFTVLAILLIDRLGRRPLVIWGLLWIIASLILCAYGFHDATYRLSVDALQELRDIPNAEALAGLVDHTFTSDIAFKAAVQEAIGEQAARAHTGILLQQAAELNAVLILTGILSFIAAFHFSIGPVMWVLLSEIFPISVRGVAIPLFALISSLVNYVVQQFFPWQLANLGGASIFMTYAVMVSVGWLILLRTLPETKNLSIEEIEQKLIRS